MKQEPFMLTFTIASGREGQMQEQLRALTLLHDQVSSLVSGLADQLGA